MATRIRIKRGTESQITGYTGTHYEGELAYATNTGNVFVSDGTAFINIGGGGETPTLQSVTDEGNTTTNNIGIGTVVLRSSSYLNVKPTSNYGVLVRNSGDDNKYISMGVPGDYGFIKYKENLGSSITINSTGVGIGTTAPSELLEVGNDSTSGNYIKIAKRDNSSAGIKISGSGGGREGFFRVNQGEDLEIGTEQTNDVTIFTNNVARINVNGDNEATQGYVGIGTTTPLYKLEVVGDARIDGGPFIIRGTNSFTTSSDTSGVLFNLGSGIRGFRFQNNNGELIRIDASGNVGIGTTAPVDKLHIKGGNIRIDSNTTAGQNLQFRNNGAPNALLSNTYNILGGSSSTTDFNTYVYGDNSYSIWTNNVNRLSVNGAGNVGIGTTTPAAKLDVNGTTYLRSVALNTVFGYSGNNIQFINTGNTTFVGNVGIGTTAPSQPLHIATNNNNTSLALRISNDHTGGRAGVTFNLPNVLNELYSVGIDNDRYFKISNGGSLSSNTRIVIAPTGNVGIGTTAPAAKLDVDGQVHLGPQSSTGFPSIDIASNGRTTIRGSAPALSVRDDNNNGGYIDMNGGTLAAINSITSTGTLSVTSTNVRFGGDIGARVNIVGQDSSSQKVLGLKQGASGSNIMIDIRNSGNTSTMGITSEGGFYFKDSDLVSRYTFDHDYSPSPADGLTTGFEFRTENASGVLTTFGYVDVTNDDKTLQESSMRLSVGQSTPTEIMRLQSDGNVGIGTTSPLYPLDLVSNSSTNTAMLRVRSTNDFGNIKFTSYDGTETLGSLYFQREGAGTGNLRFYTSNANNNQERLRITPIGNVGIGTTAPSEKLEVVGDIASQGIYVDRTHEGVGINEPFAKFGLHCFHGDANSLYLGKINNPSNYIRLATQGGSIRLNSTNGSIELNNRANSIQSVYDVINIGNVQHNAANNNYGNYISVTNNTNATGVRGRVDINGDLRIVDYSTSSPIEKTKIKNDGSAYFSGNVGIGTTSPSTSLHIKSTTAGGGYATIENTVHVAKLSLKSSSYTGHLVMDGTGGYISGGGLILDSGTNPRIQFLQSGSSKMAIVNGNVGIGTTAPDSKLHVKATSGIAFKVDPNNADKEWYIDTTNPDHLKKEGNLILNADPTNVHTSTKISFNIDGSNKASINSDGDLGIGTTAQTSKVHVDGTAMRQLRMGTAGGPSSNTDTSGAIGDMAYDDNYFYIKTASGWGRVQLDFGF